MQLAQLYRRGVLRPLDERASAQLARFRVDEPIRVEWLPVMSDEQFARIWASGALQQINEACGIQISDYEEVELNASDVPTALAVLQKSEERRGEVVTFLDSLKGLLTDATNMATNVYFVF